MTPLVMGNNLESDNRMSIGAQATDHPAINPREGSSPKARVRAPMPTKTSCLISNYNYKRYIADAVDSALAQTAPLDEIIIVDDGSTDGSQEFIRDRYYHPKIQLITKENGGQLSCFNEGFRVATGDVIFFLDADDV